MAGAGLGTGIGAGAGHGIGALAVVGCRRWAKDLGDTVQSMGMVVVAVEVFDTVEGLGFRWF